MGANWLFNIAPKDGLTIGSRLEGVTGVLGWSALRCGEVQIKNVDRPIRIWKWARFMS